MKRTLISIACLLLANQSQAVVVVARPAVVVARPAVAARPAPAPAKSAPPAARPATPAAEPHPVIVPPIIVPHTSSSDRCDEKVKPCKR